jgi:hypothetical protein
MNEQLSRLTPFSQQVAPGLAWRSRLTQTDADAKYGVKTKNNRLVASLPDTSSGDRRRPSAVEIILFTAG